MELEREGGRAGCGGMGPQGPLPSAVLSRKCLVGSCGLVLLGASLSTRRTSDKLLRPLDRHHHGGPVAPSLAPQREPELFSQYHDGWKRQIGSWPKKPVDVAIAWLKKHKWVAHRMGI